MTVNPRETEAGIDPRLAQWTVQAVCRLLSTYAVVQGLNIVLSDSARWSTVSFTVALGLPGAPATWGFALLTFGAVALVGSLFGMCRPVMFGLVGGAVWCVFFAWSFFASSLEFPDASATGAIVYCALGILFVLIAVVYCKSGKLAR